VISFAVLLLVLLAALGSAFGVTLSRWLDRASPREIRLRLALLGLMALTVALASASAGTAGAPDLIVWPIRLAGAGLLTGLWVTWWRADRRPDPDTAAPARGTTQT
jgi:peptidoglycan/LPS O-acetylase OafA/YrhL